MNLNDAGDSDTGPNNLQNFPELTFAATNSGSTYVGGNLQSTINTQFRLEIFSNAVCGSSGHGEGETFLGFTDLSPDGRGDESFLVNFPVEVPGGQFLTATATDPNGNTSEFSQCIPVAAIGLTQVTIDIKPKSDPNSINLGSQGSVSVAILTDGSFDTTTVDPASVGFASAQSTKWAVKDVDKDKDNDLIFHFDVQDLDLNIIALKQY